jgi:hypothetical protein
MIDKNEFKEKYDAVFNENGSVKLCGREKCKDLVIACMVLSKNGGKNYFGNPDTGMMNVENIQRFKKGLLG